LEKRNLNRDAAHKNKSIFHKVKTACAAMQQLQPGAQGITHGLRVERAELSSKEVKRIRTGRVIVLAGIGYTAAQGLSSVEFSKD